MTFPSDRTVLLRMFDRAGVAYELDEDGSELLIRAGMSPSNVGYMEFFTTFEFAPDGSLRTVGAWE